ncbi:MAG TPA: twin-arginine translocation signal domain-containing protein, partial [Candidatus Margulisiibacteriota bacterium]|nr:twin-arginine translocation signal domain-containing protein [Candidatus Margulisiibacteriota bacterium]
MAITRRQFITRTGLAAAGSFLGPSLLRNPWVQQVLAQTIGDRYFIVVFLDGGNDGLNTVTPIANGTSGNLRAAYEAARNTGTGGLQLLASELAATAVGNDPNSNTPLALHPGLTGLKQLYDLGKVAVIQGCGYPDYSLSHDVSRHSWQSAIPGGAGVGWVGRYLAANYT